MINETISVWVKQIQSMICMLTDLELAVICPEKYKAPEEDKLRNQLEVVLGYKRA